MFCLGVTVGAVVVRYPDAFADANATARANAALDYVDRELGGGNSVLPDQAIVIEARGRIPPDETFTVAVGEPQEGWSELSTPRRDRRRTCAVLPPPAPRGRRRALDPLLRVRPRARIPGAEPVWEDEEGLSILRRAR